MTEAQVMGGTASKDKTLPLARPSSSSIASSVDGRLTAQPVSTPHPANLNSWLANCLALGRELVEDVVVVVA